MTTKNSPAHLLSFLLEGALGLKTGRFTEIGRKAFCLSVISRGSLLVEIAPITADKLQVDQ